MFGSPISINTLLIASENRETAIEVPPSEIKDKILFMLNNLSAANFEANAKEFTAILAEHYYPWFAEYLVMKRYETTGPFCCLLMNLLAFCEPQYSYCTYNYNSE